jgi:xylose isomerase
MPLRDLRPQRVRRSPEDLVAQMQRFTLVPKFSVGIWYFSTFAGRFHDRYAPEVPIEARL